MEETAAPAPGTRRRKRRGRNTLLAVLALGTGGVVAVAALGGGGKDPNGGAKNELPPNTATVEKQTLKDTQSKDGKLAYGEARPASSRLPGTLTALPAEGERISRGAALFEVDDKPVVLLYGSKPAYRALKPGAEGSDVKQLERNLAALGYTGFTVDDEYSDHTAQAVKEWQEDLNLPETGQVELGRVVYAPGEVRVDSLAAAEGGVAAPGGKVLAYTGTAKAVTVDLEAGDQRLAKKGAEVTVRLPDDKAVKGKITAVTTEIQAGSGGQGDQTKIKVVIGLKGKNAQSSVRAYEQAAVHVDFTADTRENVLTVPVAALLAFAEGGFGVEVVNGPATKYLPVRTGLFADGRVEISGSGIAAGMKVGMPK